MPLIVEDGTGLADAEAYIGVTDFRAWCAGRGLDLGTATDAELEISLRLGADFIENHFRYKGVRATMSQGLEFPRRDLTDWSGYEVTGVPKRVKQANAELAFKSRSEPLYVDLDRGGQVTSESVGPISVTYADGAPVGKVFRFAEKLLEQFIRQKDAIDVPPAFVEPGAPDFDRAMFDFGGVGSED